MVKAAIIQDTEAKILAAAGEVFRANGKDGAKMQEIADAAGINKAMLHYYFRSKDQLFETVFTEAAQLFFEKLNGILNADKTLFEMIEALCGVYLTMATENPHFPLFILGESNRNTEGFMKKIFSSKATKPEYNKFRQLVQVEIKQGHIKQVKPEQIIMNILSLCIFPAMAKPMMKMGLGLTEKDFVTLIEERRQSISALIIDSIRKK
jgi:TetR/AcrR family transcriptional regulator